MLSLPRMDKLRNNFASFAMRNICTIRQLRFGSITQIYESILLEQIFVDCSLICSFQMTIQ